MCFLDQGIAMKKLDHIAYFLQIDNIFQKLNVKSVLVIFVHVLFHNGIILIEVLLPKE